MTGGEGVQQPDRLPMIPEAAEEHNTSVDLFETQIKALQGDI